MQVSDTVKQQYHSDSIHKSLVIEFPEMDLTLSNSAIYEESMQLKESLLENNSIEFVGCIASMFSVQVYGLYDNIKGKKMIVSIHTENTQEEPVPLFSGIVDSAMLQSNKKSKKITAYDELYTKGNTDVSSWYNSLTFPISLANFRNSLFDFIGIEQKEIVLPNDSVTIDKKYDPKSLKALNVMKAICQINGAFGIINRYGKFEYRILADLSDTYPYPSVTLYPSTSLFPASPAVAPVSTFALTAEPEEQETESFAFYKNVDYEEYQVKPVDKLTIRQSENDTGVSYGSGTNNYIIQGNMFTLGKSTAELQQIAQMIYGNVQGVYYHPFSSENNGLPYVECGVDAVSYVMQDYGPTPSTTVKNFYVFSREMTGIQALRDNYSAQGEEYQTEFVTDLQTQIDEIKVNVKEEVQKGIEDYDFTSEFEDYTYDKTYLDEQFGEQLKVMSVAALPANPDPNTIYLIQGTVVVN